MCHFGRYEYFYYLSVGLSTLRIQGSLKKVQIPGLSRGTYIVNWGHLEPEAGKLLKIQKPM